MAKRYVPTDTSVPKRTVPSGMPCQRVVNGAIIKRFRSNTLLVAIIATQIDPARPKYWAFKSLFRSILMYVLRKPPMIQLIMDGFSSPKIYFDLIVDGS